MICLAEKNKQPHPWENAKENNPKEQACEEAAKDDALEQDMTEKQDEQSQANKPNQDTHEGDTQERSQDSGQTKIAKEIEEAQEKYAQLEDKYLRLAAEYENYKRRTQREKEALYDDAVAETISHILPILDNIDRAQQSVKDAKDVKAIAEGVQMIAKLAADTFEKLGVEPIEAKGKNFDAQLHNAVMHVEDDEYGENEVIEEFLKGYKYKDKVIRHSMVKVAN